jgi:hypothetical protein
MTQVRWAPFWLLFNSLLLVVFGLVELTFGEAKSDKKNDNFLLHKKSGISRF